MEGRHPQGRHHGIGEKQALGLNGEKATVGGVLAAFKAPVVKEVARDKGKAINVDGVEPARQVRKGHAHLGGVTREPRAAIKEDAVIEQNGQHQAGLDKAAGRQLSVGGLDVHGTLPSFFFIISQSPQETQPPFSKGKNSAPPQTENRRYGASVSAIFNPCYG